MPIRKLSASIIRQIAAGEVITRPYSIVKELLENALDAGATQIEIELEHGGTQLIKITDNGEGIAEEDLSLVFDRYSTSKLGKVDDLFHLQSFGFRGEALYSIAAIAEVTLQTKTVTQHVGNEIRSQRGMLQPIAPIGHKTGTTITVSDIFGHFPVRKKTLKQRQELNDIVRLVQAYSLEFPSVSFQISHHKKNLWTCFSQENYEARVEKLWKLKTTQGFSVHSPHPYFQLKGWLSNSEHFVTHRRHMMCFINHRVVDSPAIVATILSAYKTFSHKGTFPQFHISLEIQPELLDVNLHPQKKTVKFLHETEILTAIQADIEKSISTHDVSAVRYVGKSIFPDLGVKEEQVVVVTGEIIQLHSTYLVVPSNQGFLLVDQHAADERLWYNTLIANITLLKKVEKKVHSTAQADLDDDEYLHSFEPNIDAKTAIIACHSAIRAGQMLTQSEMQSLVKKILEQGIDALVCPHGRPTYIHITMSQLQKMFRR